MTAAAALLTTSSWESVTPRTTDRANDDALVNQRNAASRRNYSIEREQVIEMHQLDSVLEDLGWSPKGYGCSRLMLRNLNGGEHRAIHSLEGHEVATGISDGRVHFPVELPGLCDGGLNDRLGLV